MDWTAQIENDRNVLARIVALLLALADLADRAADASYPVRLQVLWAFQLADAVARELVAGPAYGTAGCLQPPAPAPRCCGSDPADFANLAASLRMLALMVSNMATKAGRLSRLSCGTIKRRYRAGGICHHSSFSEHRKRQNPPSAGRPGLNIRAPPRPPARLHLSLPSWPGRTSPARRRSRRDTSSGAHARASARRPG